jgi:hypothetical protein
MVGQGLAFTRSLQQEGACEHCPVLLPPHSSDCGHAPGQSAKPTCGAALHPLPGGARMGNRSLPPQLSICQCVPFHSRMDWTGRLAPPHGVRSEFLAAARIARLDGVVLLSVTGDMLGMQGVRGAAAHAVQSESQPLARAGREQVGHERYHARAWPLRGIAPALLPVPLPMQSAVRRSAPAADPEANVPSPAPPRARAGCAIAGTCANSSRGR